MAQEKVLIVEDSLPMALIYEQCLRQADFQTTTCASGREALEALDAASPDIVLLDLNLPDMGGMDILPRLKNGKHKCGVIIITGQASLNTAVKAMQAGADDFVAKPIDPERLKASVANVLARRLLDKTPIAEAGAPPRTGLCQFIGASPDMLAAYRMIENAANSSASVLVTGESGTGKELAAHAIHTLGNRKNQNFVALNCAAIPHDLLESEIFGHVKGAFTGAAADRDGAAKRADKGTLFLDELTEMPLGLQSKLLRFVQTGTYSPVGSNQVVQADIRFVSATNRSPLEAVVNGTLREDLYYRFAVIPLNLPPLRRRGDDVLKLSRYFLDKANRQERKNFRDIDAGAAGLLTAHSWPGNVRELENVIRHAVIMNQGDVVTADMLQRLVPQEDTPKPATSSKDNQFFDRPDDVVPMAGLERAIITEALAVCGDNITEAARRLALNPSTIHRKLKQWEDETP